MTATTLPHTTPIVINGGHITIGLDPGFDRLGYGVLSGAAAAPRHVVHGCLTAPKTLPFDERLFRLANDLELLLNEHRPAIVGVEKLFFAKNAKTVMAVAEVRGVIILLARRFGACIRELTPLQVKQGVTGTGGADKKQVQLMVKTLLKLPDRPRPDDAADALAIALCSHAAVRI